MRYIFILFLLFVPGMLMASENLIENMSSSGNVTITDGVIRQVEADPLKVAQWKLQMWFDNKNHNNRNWMHIWGEDKDSLGFLSVTFTTPDDLDGLLYVRFGLNGIERDTTVKFDIKDVMPNTTYTIQWRVLNITQGEMSWTDMRVVHCGDGYSLALGDENCSRECENQSVDGGYIPPNVMRVYEPEMCTYDLGRLVCEDDYVRIENVCEQMCMTGVRHLHAGDIIHGLYVNKKGSPALHVEYNGQVCYGHLSPGNGQGLNVDLNGAVYHVID